MIRRYEERDVKVMADIWNEVVAEGNAFPQEDELTYEEASLFFASQTYCGVFETGGVIKGLYILHPNNVGRCGHISNASFAVSKDSRGLHIGAKLVADCLLQAERAGFGILQFNAVVEDNVHARHLYERLGFKSLGVIEKGFRMPDGTYKNICPYYRETGDINGNDQ